MAHTYKKKVKIKSLVYADIRMKLFTFGTEKRYICPFESLLHSLPLNKYIFSTTRVGSEKWSNTLFRYFYFSTRQNKLHEIKPNKIWMNNCNLIFFTPFSSNKNAIIKWLFWGNIILTLMSSEYLNWKNNDNWCQKFSVRVVLVWTYFSSDGKITTHNNYIPIRSLC